MAGFRKRFQSGFEKVRDYSLSLVSGDRDNKHDIQADDGFCRDIIYSIRKLDHYLSLSVEEKIESIRRIGIVSWTGGPLALRKAGDQIPRFLKIYPSECIEVKIEIIKALSQICCLNQAYQNIIRTEGFLKDIVDFLRLHDPTQIELQKWIIYTLLTLLADNIENQRYILNIRHCEKTFSNYQTESWYTWNRNEANMLISMLGYGRK